MRIFIASVLSRANQTALREALRALIAATDHRLRSVPAGPAHLTFSFIPRATDDDVVRIGEALRRLAPSASPVEIRVARAELLRAGSLPRLVYAPISTGRQDLERLAAGIDRAIRAAVPHLDVSATKSPHITLARFRKDAGPPDAGAVERALSGSALAALDLVDAVSALQLMRSSTTQARPEYAQLLAVPLER